MFDDLASQNQKTFSQIGTISDVIKKQCLLALVIIVGRDLLRSSAIIPIKAPTLYRAIVAGPPSQTVIYGWYCILNGGSR